MIITDDMVKKICNEIDEIDSLIPDNLKEAHKDVILYGRGCFVIDKDGVTPIGQGVIQMKNKIDELIDLLCGAREKGIEPKQITLGVSDYNLLKYECENLVNQSGIDYTSFMGIKIKVIDVKNTILIG